MAKNDSQVMSNTRRRQPVSLADVQHAFRDTRSELKKVTWPTGEQTRNLTLVVLAVCVIMGVFLFVVDTILTAIVHAIIGA